MDIEEELATKRGEKFSSEFFRGLPFGLKLPGGIVSREDVRN